MSTDAPTKRAAACPLCGRPVEPKLKPFCSQGCRDRDLLNWLRDGYRVPGAPADPEAMQGGRDGLDSDREPPL